MKKINEIFHSIQGEGCRAGIPSVFVRFSGCNLRCGFCDTLHQPGKMMSDDEIIEIINRKPSAQIILTGGEPALFIDEKFISRLHEHTGLPVAIETNGTCLLPPGIDWVTVSPKVGMTDVGEASVIVERADELKVVDIGQDLNDYFRLGCVTPDTVMLLQPCYVEDALEREKNTRRTIQRVLDDPRWRLSLQTHRMIGVR